jgi:hypothetical protein
VDPRLGNGDRLLFHHFVDGHSVSVGHLVKLIDAHNATVSLQDTTIASATPITVEPTSPRGQHKIITLLGYENLAVARTARSQQRREVCKIAASRRL